MSLMYGNGIFVIYNISNKYYTSTDGINWTHTYTSALNDNQKILHFANNKFITYSTRDTSYEIDYLESSSDGITWTKSNQLTKKWYIGCAYGDGIYMTTDSSGENMYTSTDTVTWTSLSTNTSSHNITYFYRGII